MGFTFRDAPKFMQEIGAVTGASLAAGTLAVLALPPAPASAAGAAALFGGSIAAAITRTRPANKGVRALLGIAAGALASFGFLALTNAFGLGLPGMMMGGALGGLALGSLLGAEEKARRLPQVAGVFAAGAMGVIGVAGIDNVANFVASENLSTSFATVAMSGLLGLWITAAAGLRRVEKTRDPLFEMYEDIMEGLVEPVRAKVKDARETYGEIEEGIAKDEQMSKETAGEASKQARRLLESILETAKTWKQIHGDVSSPRLAGLDDKLKDLEKRITETTDPVTQGHLQRAAQALSAQKAAVDGLKVGCGRAEAAIDAQAALLERLRLAVAQHRVSDRERFAVEVSAVADQVSRLSDDLENLSQAIAEAEAVADRKVLADLERAGRRALAQLDGGTPAKVEEKVEEPVVH